MAASSWQAAPPMSGASWQLPPLQPRRVMIEHEVDEDSWTATLETEVKLNMAAARGSLELAASYDKAFVEIGRGLVLQHEWNRLHFGSVTRCVFQHSCCNCLRTRGSWRNFARSLHKSRAMSR